MSNLLIRRDRLIPKESVLLKDDVILHRDAHLIVSSWDSFHPRDDLVRGLSCYYLSENIKFSKVIHRDLSHHWYCDIADYTFAENDSLLVMTDLLADVDIRDGNIRVLDLDELADAHEAGLISDRLLKKSLRTLDRLLRELYRDGVSRLAAPLQSFSPDSQNQ